jgi:thiol-disulfide isomerase/thioredoxin
MRPLYASILATTTALQTCKVQDLATRRIAGALLAPFGGRAGAAHELVAVRGIDQDGSPIAGLCDAATIGATVPLTVSVPRPLAPLCVLTAIECAAALATEGLKATPETITLLGATPEALAACELLTSLGADVTVVSPRKSGDDDAYAAGAAMAFHPAALDDEDEEDYGLVLDYVGDEGSRKGYVSCTPFDARHAQDWGLGEKRPPSLTFDPVVKRIEHALNEAPADVLEEAPSTTREFFNPIKTAASLAIGDAAEAYGEALGWPADGETRKRFGIDVLAPSLGAVSFAEIEEALDSGDWDDDIEVDEVPTSPDSVAGDAVVFITAKCCTAWNRNLASRRREIWCPHRFCNSCRRMDPHFRRMQRAFDKVRFLRVDSTTDRSFAEAAGVDSTPTFLLYRDGSRVATVGTASPTLLRRELADAFESSKVT